ncbi:MAG: peptide chain release factor N(5)-glutamine methyltransferase [Pseudomonadota bacterium]
MSAGFEGLLQAASAQLTGISEQPRDEAEWLLAELLGIERSRLRFADIALTPAQATRYADWLTRRAAGEPLAYLCGTQPFRRLMLQVSPDVLIPRADTETLVEWALALLKPMRAAANVLDACTGSGCVALALADEAAGHRYHASDCSAAALAVAEANAQRLNLPVQFFQADALQLPAALPRFQLITANPPYIAEGDPHLPALRHEPTLALVSGADGLHLLRGLIEQAPARLLEGGWLLLEHGYDQAGAVRALLAERGFVDVETRRDEGDRERVSGGRWGAAHG